LPGRAWAITTDQTHVIALLAWYLDPASLTGSQRFGS